MSTYIYVLPLTDNDATSIDLARLPQWRREQTLRFKHRQGQVECAASYLLLCRVLKEVYGIDCQPDFIVGEHGKPTLKQFPHIHFNMSHCRNAVAVAVSDQPVGIDIERVGRYSDSVVRYAFSDDEQKRIAKSGNPQEAFTRLWTQKEAVVKLSGIGITDNMKTLLADISACIHTQLIADANSVVSVATMQSSQFTIYCC